MTEREHERKIGICASCRRPCRSSTGFCARCWDALRDSKAAEIDAYVAGRYDAMPQPSTRKLGAELGVSHEMIARRVRRYHQRLRLRHKIAAAEALERKGVSE